MQIHVEVGPFKQFVRVCIYIYLNSLSMSSYDCGLVILMIINVYHKCCKCKTFGERSNWLHPTYCIRLNTCITLQIKFNVVFGDIYPHIHIHKYVCIYIYIKYLNTAKKNRAYY